MLSLNDVAAVNILEKLVDNFGFQQETSTVYRKQGIRVFCIDGSMLTAEDEVAQLDADLILVASKHVSESGRPCLLAHSTGNWGASAEYGGKPHSLSMTSAYAIHGILHTALDSVQSMGLDYMEVGMEATHHGPYSDKPLIFVELGSSPQEWKNNKMAEAVAQTIHDFCFKQPKTSPEPAAGFGGGHYVRDILKPVFENRYAVGHVASKHHFPLSKEMIFQAFSRTSEKPRTALIDWDGLKSDHRSQLVGYLAEMGFELVKV